MTVSLGQTNLKIVHYLADKHPEFISPTEIGVEVGGKTKSGLTRHSAWASPKLKKLVRWGYVVRNSRGHYKFLHREDI